MRPKRPAAYTCVNMLGVYLSATPHGSSRQAYLSGLACIINILLIVSKKIQKRRTTRIWKLKDTQNINTHSPHYADYRKDD